ncbi:ABC transporter ATP-binding protein [Amycolatopsis aidingensis]|uniref:ABC transporter ATP-binding protein n=1 Tax=Amycolatopsis aidingensis TaxID=2842453 RepID=UPI001C0C060E|nr:ABC transporter ATP-binding protein [Amycolatopsis aidingensis]
MSLLDVDDINVSFATPDGTLHAVRDASFELESGQALGIVGESGSGKSVLMQTVLGLTRGARVSGHAYFEGRDLLAMAEAERRRIRGARIGMVFQDPLTSLHPHYRAGWQIIEMIRAHRDVSKRDARARAIELLDRVGIPQPDRRVDAFPHELSGGMRQRVMIAMAMALEPALLIADEPTTALDVTVQAQILALMTRLREESGSAVIVITHDLGVVAEMADTIMVMYAGGPVERADRRTLYQAPHHPYTRGLLRSLPSGERGTRIDSIAGQPPSLVTVPPGCPFHPRCPFVMDRCVTDSPVLRPVEGAAQVQDHRSACWLPEDAVGLGTGADERRSTAARAARGPVVRAQLGSAS